MRSVFRLTTIYISMINNSQKGFTIVEIVVASMIFPILVIGIASAFTTAQKIYTASKQLNEVYAVLSACPEIDRALEFSTIGSGTNCYPNNSFIGEGSSARTFSYTPTLTVTDTSSLSSGDPLKAIPDSKVVDVKTGYSLGGSTPLELRLLITRNGIAQQ